MSQGIAQSKPHRRPRPKYQVFISSTYADLHNERQAVTWEVLKARHIPAGMENFTATDDRGWRTISRTIDLSDYYIVIVAGRYGSVDPTTGMSWTEREYLYARDQGMRVLAFIREDAHITADKSENESEPREKLSRLKEELRGKHLCEQWGTTDDLKSKVVQALQNQIGEDEDSGEPRPGWYRGDEIGGPSTLEEFARLSSENAELKSRLDTLTGDTKEQLELIEQDGNPVHPRRERETQRVRVVTSPSSAFMADFGRPRPADLEEYINAKRQTVWLEFRVLNRGQKPARNVVADFRAVPVSGVYVHSLRRSSPIVIKQAATPFYLDPSEHTYVEYRREADGVGEIRQRVKQIAVGGHEDLIAMGFQAQTMSQSDEDVQIEITYNVRSEDGVTTEGKFSVTMHFRGTVEFSMKEAEEDDD